MLLRCASRAAAGDRRHGSAAESRNSAPSSAPLRLHPCDSGKDFDGISIKKSGPIAPVLDSVDSRLRKSRMSTDQRHFANGPVGSNNHAKSNSALDMIIFRVFRVNGLNSVHQPSGLHASADHDSHGRGAAER
jgi:hypothetical protein